MEELILTTIKNMLGIDITNDETFDEELTVHLNALFSTLHQLGVGPTEGFRIITGNEKWSDYTDNTIILGMIKDYLYMKTKIAFDPPSSSYVLDSFKSIADELQWRLNIQAEN